MVTKSTSVTKLGKQTQAELAESEGMALALIRSAGTGIYVIEAGRVKYVNSLFQELTGCTEEELIGKYSLDLVHPDDKEMVRRKAIENLKGQTCYPYEYRFVKKSGEIAWVLERITAVEYGGKRATVRSFMDITERKQAEEALRKSEERFQTLFDTMSQGVILMDASRQIVKANSVAERMLRLECSESEETTYRTTKLDMVHPDGRPLLPEEMATSRAMQQKGPVMGIIIGIRYSDGTILWLNCNAIPLLDSNSEVQGVVATFSDITERKQAEDERKALLQDLEEINLKLERSNRDLQDFVYVASHDLREPLRKITSFGSLLQDSLEGKLDEDQEENFGFMIDGGKRMQEMIDDLLIYSRVTTKAKPFERVDLNEVIENMKKVELATLLDETKGIIHVSEALPPVQGDPAQMHQLFQNLIGNGLKFHREGIPPEVTIRARRAENNILHVEVQDNGIGIDEEYHEQVFTMFKRLHSREHYAGTGIGLAICKKIVNRHGGDIGIKSTPGGGSIFWFTLPRGSY